MDSGDSAAGLDESGGFVLHEEMEGGEIGGMGREEVEEVPLRHESDEFCLSGKMGEISHWKRVTADSDGQIREFLVWEREKFVENSEFMEKLKSGGMDGIAAKVPQEVTVLLDHRHPQPRPSQQQSEHRPRRPAPRDHAVDPLHRPSFTPARPSGYPGSVGAGNRPVRS